MYFKNILYNKDINNKFSLTRTCGVLAPVSVRVIEKLRNNHAINISGHLKYG